MKQPRQSNGMKMELIPLILRDHCDCAVEDELSVVI